MKICSWIIFFFLISNKLLAQQVTITRLDSCFGIDKKATIIINNNLTANSLSSNPANGTFTFTLTTSASTSAGVYNSFGVLIRTLWSGMRYAAGVYSVQWDNLLDDGVTTAPFGVYTAKVLSNNVTYDWLGVIGNTSASHITNQFLTPFLSLVSTNGFVYVAGGYAERDLKTNKFSTSNIGALLPATDPTQTNTQTMAAYHVCTNGTTVFWAGGDAYSGAKSFIYASNPTDDSQVIFTNSKTDVIGIDGRQYHSVLAIDSAVEDGQNGIAANSSFLFVSWKYYNTIQTYSLSNNSGALLKTTNFGTHTPGSIAVYGNYLWVNVNSSVAQYNINSDGSLTASGVSIAVSQVGAMAISTGGELAIIDLSTKQVRFYNATTGATSAAPLGQAGGYDTNGPLVTYDKFMFNAINNAGVVPAIAYQADGSFWFSDISNYRVLHFNADKSYKEQIAYVPTSRSCNVDQNNPTRVFADYLEYQVDYSKVATDINNSWVLKYNWNVGTNLNVFGQFVSVTTLSNNHTYAIGKADAGGIQLYDLRSTGAVQVGILNYVEPTLEADGSIYTRTISNSQAVVTKYALTGFDSNFMPQWGAGTVIATTPVYAEEQPFTFQNNTRGASTNPNRYFFFNPDPRTDSGLPVYHLGSIPVGGTSFEWKTSRQIGYLGPYPLNGNYYNDGGHSENCLANVNGSNVFWHVNSELGYLTEATQSNHYNEDGLFIGHFGNDNLLQASTGDTRFWAGNSFKTALAKVGPDLYYFYCDESKHGGVHIIRVSNLASIREQSLPITVSAPVTIVPDANSLMTGLPFKGTSLNNATGWVVESGSPTFQTNLHQYSKDSIDITISGGTGDRAVSRYLGNQTLSSYTVTGGVNFNGSQNTFNDFNIYNFVGIADKNGKQIACLFSRQNGTYINNVKVAPLSLGDENLFKDFSFTYTAGSLVFKFSNYAPVTISTTWEPGADISSPGRLNVAQHVVNYRNDYTALDLYKLRFKVN